ncbi:choline transporter-like protein [Capsaspora owczarzaki ATCC 30864]|uniref:Choline transporter-like protein n=1 Tax=Capsaspora owczarzaki (strain ATCC 30864) TaxID=595528 RepID=A0A0D2UAT2_CAPO3|nr:choline transporter-like protein [Capsaspora owczarzaki ATCC 30864]KJE92111.1 choline transporter-like protein [Capsaspora owczarzaki ATCC 30864]|eukprot:XP_004363972.1 choline transporter-like protein [Capsaspora owczarzaki ATCC 30864]
MAKGEDIELKEDKIAYDPDFKGPIHNRKCTDVPCCLLFIVFWIGMIIIAAFGFANGDPFRLINPVDSMGNICGELNDGLYGDQRNNSYLFFFDITKCDPVNLNCLQTTQVCVPECPTASKFVGVNMDYDEAICRYTFAPSDNNELEDFVLNGTCAPYQLQSTTFLKRCIPDFSVLTQNFSYILDGNTVEVAGVNLTASLNVLLDFFNTAELSGQVLSDLEAAWVYILAGCAIAVAMAFVWLFLLRFIAGFMVWMTLLGALAGSAAATGICFQQYKEHRDLSNSLPYNLHFNTIAYQEYTFLVLGIISAVVCFVLFVCVVFLRNRIKIAIEIIKEAARAMAAMPSMIFLPIITMGALVAFLIWWIWVAAFLATSGEASFNDPYGLGVNITCTPPADQSEPTNCTFLGYTSDSLLRSFQIYHLVGLFWTTNLLTALSQVTIAGAVATWYWTRDHKNLPWFPIIGSLKRALIYHLGSIAFGSLILALVQVARVMLEYIDRQTRTSQSEFVKVIVKCFRCCLWCLEKFIRFLNKNAYIEIAVYGYSFCHAAVRAFELLTRNILRLAFVDKVGDFVIFLGKMMVACTASVLTWYILKNRSADLNYFMLPVIVVAVFAYMIAKGIFSVFDMTIDTIFLCFCEDCERNDGTAEKPYYMSEKLQRIVGHQNEKPAL